MSIINTIRRHKFSTKIISERSGPGVSASSRVEGDQLPPRVWKSSANGSAKYTIRRNVPFNTLPVYSVMKPGLGQILTLIKKIDGDLYEFKKDLVSDFPGSNPVLKLHLNQVLCRGKISKEVKLWLQDRGF